MCQVRNKVDRCKRGTILFQDSFPGLSRKYVNNVLGELVREGVLVRMAQGIYLKPKRTRFGIVYPSQTEIVRLIAQRDKAQVLPSGETALNLLGLSEQVPMTSTYVTSGSARNLNINGKVVKLTTSVPKTFAPKNGFMASLFLALKAWDKKELNGEFENNVMRLLHYHADKKQSMLPDLQYAPVWIQDYLRAKIETL